MPRLTAAGCSALILLGIAVLSACSNSTSTPPSESSFTIISSLTSSGTGSVTNNAADGGATDTSGTGTGTGTATVTVTPTQTTTVIVSPSPSPSPIPTQAPVTGGGGTAGFQDGLLVVIGAAAIAAGAGGLAYRRRLNRHR